MIWWFDPFGFQTGQKVWLKPKICPPKDLSLTWAGMTGRLGLVDGDPYNGLLLLSLYNLVVFHPLYNRTNRDELITAQLNNPSNETEHQKADPQKNIFQVIQFVTFSSPSWRSPTTFKSS